MSGVTRVDLEASSPDSATVRKVISVKVTPRSSYLDEQELRKDEDPGVKMAYRRCKEILNESALPWRRIIDLRTVPRRVVSPPIRTKVRTVYDKIADSYIANVEALESAGIGRRGVVGDPRITQLEELRLEVGEGVWSTLLTYFPFCERPANIEVADQD